jgi:hypothetical protein
MNEIQKANAKVAIEYYQKVLSGETFESPVYEDGAGREIHDSNPDFSSCDVRYYWPQEVVEHKGGRYPKPVAVEDIAGVNQYYVADPLSDGFFDSLYGPLLCEVFNRQVNRGIVHETKEAAIAHAKVMLGVSDE